jgi:hypothetical protein
VTPPRLLTPLVAVVFAIGACRANPAPSGTAGSAASIPPARSTPMTIGVEYAILGVASEYGDAGATYAKLQDAYVIWGNLQPEAGGDFRWGPLDAVVLEYQAAGLTGIQMNLTALSPWASTVEPKLLNKGNTFPKAEYLDDYAAYVAAVVERYDGDGMDDMPGLRAPIHDYGVEREFTGFWPGSAAEYVRLLEIAAPAIRAADPKARVLLVALLMTDVFDGSPSQAEIRRRLSTEIDYMRKSVPDIRTILAACDHYDIVDFHSLGNYTEIPPTVAWIRAELREAGCGPRPIWIGDAFPMSLLVGYGGLVPPTPFAPATAATGDAAVAVLKAVADPGAPDHAAAEAWLRAEVAIGLTRKLVVSAGEGLLGINVGNLEDWRTGAPAFDAAAVPGLGAAMFMGLTDTTKTNRRPGGALPYHGQDWDRARSAGDRRPGWYALRLVETKLAGYSSVLRLDLGVGVWAYRFETPGGPRWVLWRDDGALRLPGDRGTSGTVRLPFDDPAALVTMTPTEAGRGDPSKLTLQASDGALTIELGPVPVFVEAAP